MNDIVIKKISTNMTDFITIDGNLDIELKKMNFELLPKDYNILFPTREFDSFESLKLSKSL